MDFDKVSQIVELAANIVTIFGVFGATCIYKIEIYNKRYITYIGRINVALEKKDVSVNAYPLVIKPEEIMYHIRKVGEF